MDATTNGQPQQVESPATVVAEEAAGMAPSPEKKEARTPVALIQRHGKRFVNEMINFGFLSGFAMAGGRSEGGSFLLQQNNNMEHAIGLKVKSRSIDVQRLYGRAVTVLVHVRGFRDEHGPQCEGYVIDIDRPSILDLPTMQVWMSGFGVGKTIPDVVKQMAREGFNPFAEDGTLKEEFRPYIQDADSSTGQWQLNKNMEQYVKALRMFKDILEASGGVVDSRLGAGQNYVSLAGFVDSKAMVPATEHRQEYGLIMLRQQRDQEENIPVRIRGPKARLFIDKTQEGAPILVEGSLRRKVIPGDDGQIVSAHTYVETARISPAVFGRDVTATPDWWSEIRERLQARKEARRAEAQTRAQNPAPKSAAEAAPLADQF